MLKPVLSAVVAFGLLGGCAAIGALNEATDPLDVYELRAPADAPAARGAPQGIDLIVEVPNSGGAIDTDRILIRPSSTQVQYLPASRWTENAPVMIQTALVEGLERSGAFRYVGRRPLGPSGDYALVTNLSEFQAEILPEPQVAQVRIRLTARLVREDDAAVVRTRSFEAVVAATDTDTASVVAAFDQAASVVFAEVIGWVMDARGVARAAGGA